MESDATKGLPNLQIVGMSNKAINEAKERVKSAIAIAILISSGQLRQSGIAGAAFAGELALDGRLCPIKGPITLAEVAKKS
ncbi:MAG: magnesium chelatase domain-containing protein [Candidatus Saccharimonadales bacterium]